MKNLFNFFKKKPKIQAVRTKDTIVLVYEGKTLNIQRLQKPEIFEEVDQLLRDKDLKTLQLRFVDISEAIKDFTKGDFTVDVEKKEVYYQGDEENPMPESLVKMLQRHFDKRVDHTALTRFWEKCQKNPLKESRNELFDFMLKNRIPLTEDGDIIVEKGVRRLDSGRLVDCHSRKVDNSVGKVVSIPRESVDTNRRNQCSYGLHVGAPNYVRNHWSSDVIIVCIVNPEDVISVPEDYNFTKMRVCKYRVVGFANATTIDPDKLVYKVEDLIDEQSVLETAKRDVEDPHIKDLESDYSKDVVEEILTRVQLEALSIKSIKELAQLRFNVNITKKLKIEVIEAIEKLQSGDEIKESTSIRYFESDFHGKTKQQIIDRVKSEKGILIQMKKKTRDQLVNEAITLSLKS